MTENELFDIIKNRIKIILNKKNKPIRVAINGIEGTGKTVFAIKLSQYLTQSNINSINISIDGFHNNKEYRYRQGRNSYKGYYEDSYNEIEFVNKVLISSQSNSPNYVESIHDLETDEYLDFKPKIISNKTVLITDGAYLFKPIYLSNWDFKIYLKTDFNTAMLRGIERDKTLLGTKEEAKEKYIKRYHKSSLFYINKCNPESEADLLIDNTDFNNLIILSS